MTTDEAINLAQQVAPLDMVSRLIYIESKRDSCDAEDLTAWTEARDLTRNGNIYKP